MQNLQQTLTEERDKVLHNANQQRSLLEESLHGTKAEEQRLRTKLVEAEEVCWPFVRLFFSFFFLRISRDAPFCAGEEWKVEQRYDLWTVCVS